jgi:phospholipid/cholesterol/gamma-HCH transport system permease protein
MPNAKAPALTFSAPASGAPDCAIASGNWQVHALAQGRAMHAIVALLASLQGQQDSAGVRWDLTRIDNIDHIGAQIFWNAWGKTWHVSLQLTPSQQEFFKRLEKAGPLTLQQTRQSSLTSVRLLGAAMLDFFAHVTGLIALIGQVMQDVMRFIRHLLRGPWREISANIHHAGFQALGITALFGLRIKPNNDSLGRGTTASVVTAITVGILADTVFAIVFNGVGF